MMARTLFDDQDEIAPLARSSDPPTSHQAAAQIAGKLGYYAAGMLQAVTTLGEATASEAARHAREADGSNVISVESYRKRAGELERAGKIEVVGTRKCKVTGKQARTFKVKA